MFYYIVEVFGSRASVVKREQDLRRAQDIARVHSARTGLLVEIQDELGRAIEQELVWRDW
jgi:thymidine phosphorylase